MHTCVAKSGVTGDASSARDGKVTLDRTESPTEDALTAGAPAPEPTLASDAAKAVVAATDAAVVVAHSPVAVSPRVGL